MIENSMIVKKRTICFLSLLLFVFATMQPMDAVKTVESAPQFTISDKKLGDHAKWPSLVDDFKVAIMKKNYNAENIWRKAFFETGSIDKVVFSPTNGHVACMVQKKYTDNDSKYGYWIDQFFYIPYIVDWKTAKEYPCSDHAHNPDVAFTEDGSKIVYRYEHRSSDGRSLVCVDIGDGKSGSLVSIGTHDRIYQGIFTDQGKIPADRLAISNAGKCAFGLEREIMGGNRKSNIFVTDVDGFEKFVTIPKMEEAYSSSSLFVWWLKFNPKDGSLLYLKDSEPRSVYHTPPRGNVQLMSIAQENNYLGVSKPPLCIPSAHKQILKINQIKDGRSVALSRDGGAIALVKEDKTVEIIWLNEPNFPQITIPGTPSAIDFSHDGRLLIGVMESSGEIVVWSTATGRLIDTFQGISKSKSISVSSDGKKLVIGGDGNLFMWEFMSDNDILALEEMKSSQIPLDQIDLLRQIYHSNQQKILTAAEQSVFGQMPLSIQEMLKSRGFVVKSIRGPIVERRFTEEKSSKLIRGPIVEGPFTEEKSSKMILDQTDKALQLGSYLKQSDVTSSIKNNETGYVQRLLSLIKYYLSGME